MDIRQLRYFLAMVDEGSISKASHRLAVAQPALSFHLRNMEAEIGAALLTRSARGVAATEAGQILARAARDIIARLEAAEHEIRGRIAEPSGEVRLGLPGTISQILAVPLIRAVADRHPGVKLRIAEAMSGFLGDWLGKDEIDLAVLYLPPASLVTAGPVLSEELCLIGPARPMTGIRAPSGSAVSLSRIVSLPLILPSSNHGLRVLLERRAAEQGLEIGTVTDVDSYGSIKELVGQGSGFSVLPVNSVAEEVASGRLRSWSVTRPALRREVHIVVAAGRPRSIALDAVQAICRDVLIDLVRTGRWKGARLA